MLSSVRTFHVCAWPDAISVPANWSLSSECSPVGEMDGGGRVSDGPQGGWRAVPGARTHVVEVQVLARVVVGHADGGVEGVHLAPKLGEGLVEGPVVGDAEGVDDAGGHQPFEADVPGPVLLPELVRAAHVVLAGALRLPILHRGEQAGGQVRCAPASVSDGAGAVKEGSCAGPRGSKAVRSTASFGAAAMTAPPRCVCRPSTAFGSRREAPRPPLSQHIPLSLMYVKA